MILANKIFQVEEYNWIKLMILDTLGNINQSHQITKNNTLITMTKIICIIIVMRTDLDVDFERCFCRSNSQINVHS